MTVWVQLREKGSPELHLEGGQEGVAKGEHQLEGELSSGEFFLGAHRVIMIITHNYAQQS